MKWVIFLFFICPVMAAVTVSPNSWDLQTIPHDSRHLKTFVLHNGSNDEVLLTAQPTGCNCIRYQIENPRLLPNTTTKVEVVVEPRGDHGDFQWQLKIKANTDEIVIPVNAKILRKFTVFPPQINLGVVKKGDVKSGKVLVMSPDHSPFTVSGIESSSDFIKVTYKQKSIENFYPRTQEGYEVAVTVDQHINFGRHEEFLTIETTIPDKKYIKVPIFIYVTGDLISVPDYIALGRIRVNQKVSKRITLYHNKFEKFSITGTTKKLEFVNVRTQEVIENKYYYVFVEVNAPKEGEFRDVIYIKTNCKTQSVIPLYLQGFAVK